MKNCTYNTNFFNMKIIKNLDFQSPDFYTTLYFFSSNGSIIFIKKPITKSLYLFIELELTMPLIQIPIPIM
ncbi:hypothetical protein BpHYR1_002103 [Brachionus plicatilis]|uniref:Uncharacterized protein n=1 Tax=Brachionus plicatilis TaxID=10195 RepID=A0A3M7T982_BRAPC|nr:hypothetical protein BpHYR1_002103 [Brachionus plicatilis]